MASSTRQNTSVQGARSRYRPTPAAAGSGPDRPSLTSATPGLRATSAAAQITTTLACTHNPTTTAFDLLTGLAAAGCRLQYRV
jgi:hypothetical protein